MLAESLRWLATKFVIPATGGSAVVTELFAVAGGVGGGRLCPVEPPVVIVVPPVAVLPPAPALPPAETPVPPFPAPPLLLTAPEPELDPPELELDPPEPELDPPEPELDPPEPELDPPVPEWPPLLWPDLTSSEIAPVGSAPEQPAAPSMAPALVRMTTIDRISDCI